LHPGRYGDVVFLMVMWLKIVAGWVVNRMGYDFLYLDSDLVYFRDPMELFTDTSVGAWLGTQGVILFLFRECLVVVVRSRG
jgi:hypothetical protein